MDRQEPEELEPEVEPVTDERRRGAHDHDHDHDDDDYDDEGETHATTGGAAAAGAVTGGVIGLTGGPIGAAIGAVGGAIVGAAAERMMHSEDDSDQPPLDAAETDEFDDRPSGPTTAEMREEPTMREQEQIARQQERRVEGEEGEEGGRPLV